MLVLGFYPLAPFSSVISLTSLFFLLFFFCWCLVFLFVVFFDRISCSLGWLWACYVAKDDPKDELLIFLTPPTTIPSSCCIGYQTQSNEPTGQELYQLICLLRQTLLFLISVFIQLIINLLLPTRSGLTKALVTTGPTNAYIPQELLYTFWICEP